METYNSVAVYVLGRAAETEATRNSNIYFEITDRKQSLIQKITCDVLNKNRKNICIYVFLTLLIVVTASLAVFVNVILNRNTQDQSVDGGWSTWGSWSECSVSCSTELTSRIRSCSNPKPSNGGDHCLGDSTEYKLCDGKPCSDQSVDGGWSTWGSWSECSVSCSTEQTSRNRSCSNPKPSNGGYYCLGISTEYKLCNRSSCLACPDGWLRHGSSCYFFSNTKGDINYAQRQCSMWRGHLVEIGSDAENTFVKEQINNPDEFYYYIGLNDINKESSFTWFGTNRDLSQTGYSHWFKGEPNNAMDKEDCVVIRRDDGYWNDYICDGPIPYICEINYLI